MPALRERVEDIIPVAEFLLARSCKKSHQPAPAIDEDAKLKLKSYSWPGNVRELDNVIQRAMVLQNGPAISAGDVQFEQMAAKPMLHTVSDIDHYSSSELEDDPATLNTDLKSHEQKVILETLRETEGSRKCTAEKLGISPRTLRYKLARMREQGIEIPA